MTKRTNKKTEAPADSTTMLQNLALFIILLSFFIVLNSISTFEEERIKPVMESIEATFASRVIRNELAPSVTDSEDMSTNEGNVFDNLNDLFQSQFRTLSDTHIDERRGLFITYIPFRKLERALVDVRPHNLKMYKKRGRFISLLRNLLDYKETTLRIDFVLQAPNDFLTMPRRKQQFITQKVADFGQKLSKAGFPKDRLSIGLEESKSQQPANQENLMVMVVIRPHVPYAPYPKNNDGGQ